MNTSIKRVSSYRYIYIYMYIYIYIYIYIYMYVYYFVRKNRGNSGDDLIKKKKKK